MFKLTWHPTPAQKEALSEKTGVPTENLRYYFDNNRRKYLKYWARKSEKTVSQEQKSDGALPIKRSVVQKSDSPLPEKKSVVRKVLQEKVCSKFEEASLVESVVTLEECLNKEESLCIGVELITKFSRCLLCAYKTKSQEAFHSHLEIHKQSATFCDSSKDTTNGCRKYFTVESFKTHVCTDTAPAFFTGQQLMTEDLDNQALAAVIQLASEGFPVCIGYEDDSVYYCNLCDNSYSVRQNLYKHLTQHEVEYRLVTPFYVIFMNYLFANSD